MTPRDIIADVMTTPGMADVLMERLREAGFAVVPIKATAGMVRECERAIKDGSWTNTHVLLCEAWNAMIEEWLQTERRT